MNFEDRLRDTFRQEAGALDHRRENRRLHGESGRAEGRTRLSAVRRLGLALAGTAFVFAAVLVGSRLVANTDEPIEVSVADGRLPNDRPIGDDAAAGETRPAPEPTPSTVEPADAAAPADEPLPADKPLPVDEAPSESDGFPTPTPVPPPPCGVKSWIALWSRDAEPGCVAVREAQELTIVNKGFDRLEIAGIAGDWSLGPDDSVTFSTSVLALGVHRFEASPYAMPELHVIAKADSPYADWAETVDGFGPLRLGMSVREVATVVQASLTRVPPDSALTACTDIILDSDPYSPLLVFDGDDTLIAAFDVQASTEIPSNVMIQCQDPDAEPAGAPTRICGGHEGPAFVAAMVRNVAADDPDGGLVVHSAPGVDTPVIGVIPYDAQGLELTGGCSFAGDTAVWWELDYLGEPGWVNARYLFSPEIQPVCGDHGWVEAVRVQDDFEFFETIDTGATNERIAGIDAQVLDDCVAVIITFGEGDVTSGVSELSAEVMGGVGIRSFNGATVVSLPSGVGDASPLVAPAPVAEWTSPIDGRPGVAALVADDGGRAVLAMNNSREVPRMATASNPARVILSYFETTPASDDFAKHESFFVTPITQRAQGTVTVRGVGAAFEAHAGVVVLDADGNPVTGAIFSGESIVGAPQQGAATFRTGNPGVAYVSFSIEISNLPDGDYELVLDSCGGQCDPPAEQSGIAFRVG